MPRSSSSASGLGCLVTAIALFAVCIIVGAGLAIGWGLVR